MDDGPLQELAGRHERFELFLGLEEVVDPVLLTGPRSAGGGRYGKPDFGVVIPDVGGHGAFANSRRTCEDCQSRFLAHVFLCGGVWIGEAWFALLLVYKIYQRLALVDAQAADPPGRRDPQLLHNRRGPDFADAGQGLQQLGHPHPRQGVVLRRPS